MTAGAEDEATGTERVPGDTDGVDAESGGSAAQATASSATGGDGGVRGEIAERIDRWVVPVVRWVRRTLWLPIASSLLAAGLGVAAAIIWLGADGDGLTTAVMVAVLALAPALGIWLFTRLLGELQRLPQTVRAAPDELGGLKGELFSAGGELRDLKSSGLLGLPSALRWLRRSLSRLDALGIAGVAAAVAALHPLRLAWILFLCWLSVIALPIAAVALLLALTL